NITFHQVAKFSVPLHYDTLFLCLRSQMSL
ncbi:hypothetical protein SK63_04541, partial [Enterobacter sp. BIDMC110]